MSKFIIEDWAGNILDHSKRFKKPCFAVALEFVDFEHAEDYLIDLLGEDYDDERGEYYIEKVQS